MQKLRLMVSFLIAFVSGAILSSQAVAQDFLGVGTSEPSLLLLILVVSLTGLASIFLLFLYRLLLSSKTDPKNYKFSSSASKRAAILFNILLIILTTSLAWWALSDIEATIKEEKRETLKTVLHTTLESMNIWSKDQSNLLDNIAANPKFLQNAKRQLALYDQEGDFKSSPNLTNIRQTIHNQQRHSNDMGFFIITPDGNNIASMEKGSLGKSNPIFLHRPGLLNRAFQGETVLVPPLPSNTTANEMGVIRGHDVAPVMYFVGPIKDETGQVIAALSIRHDPQAEFSRINLLGRIGDTGETYSFDKQGKFLSKSRFEHQLISIGLLDAFEQSVLSILIRNPGVNLVNGEVNKTPRHELPLTLMAAHATRGEEGFNIDGYLDYRGVPVIGAWKWDHTLGIGVASELDVAEAMTAYYSARFIVIMILIITLSVSIAFTVLSMILGKRANQSLQEAHDQLENRVQERTKELETALESLEESEERFVLALRATNEGLWDWNYKTNVVYYNKRWMEMVGYDVNELPGTLETWEKLVHPDDIDGAVSEMEAALDGYQSGFNIEFRMKHKSGHWVPINSRAYVVRDGASKEVKRVVGTHIDMTQEKQAAYALKEAKAETERAFVELLKEKKIKTG